MSDCIGTGCKAASLMERIAALEAERADLIKINNGWAQEWDKLLHERDALTKDAVSLLQRARAIINRWQELYGEFQPQFLPPAHQIEWAEDASEFIDAAREKP